jgi:hypothetical protein
MARTSFRGSVLSGSRALPTATCPICAATLAQMEIELDGYHDRAGALWGVGLSYEGLKPPGAHLLVGAFNMAWLEAEQRAGHNPAAGVIVDFARTRAFLTWLTTLPYPTNGYHPITAAESAFMAIDNPPGHGAAGTDKWVWQGGGWTVSIPALAGVCALNVGQAMPPDEPYSLSATIALTRLLAQITLQGRIAGEPE